jgi:hypothetical protein
MKQRNQIYFGTGNFGFDEQTTGSFVKCRPPCRQTGDVSTQGTRSGVNNSGIGDGSATAVIAINYDGDAHLDLIVANLDMRNQVATFFLLAQLIDRPSSNSCVYAGVPGRWSR